MVDFKSEGGVFLDIVEKFFIAPMRKSTVKARELVGLTGIERSISRGRTSWYIRTGDMKGVYELILFDGRVDGGVEPIKAGAASHFSFSFVIKYFPSEDDEFFDDFAFYEKAVRMSGLFAPSGVPVIEYKDMIHETYYNVGTAYFSAEKRGRHLHLVLETQGRLVDYRLDGLTVSDVKGQTIRVLNPGEVDRNVPAWRVCWSLFDKLVRAIAYAYASPPHAIYFSEAPGKVWYVDGQGRVDEKVSKGKEHVLRKLGVVFVLAEGDEKNRVEEEISRLLEKGRMKDPNLRVVRVGERLYLTEAELPKPLVNDEWWRVKKPSTT